MMTRFIFPLSVLLTALLVQAPARIDDEAFQPATDGDSPPLVDDDSTWGVVSPGVNYVITPSGFKEPPGPGEGAGIIVSRFRFEIRGTPGGVVTVAVSLPQAFVSNVTPDSLPLTQWIAIWYADDVCNCLDCCYPWPQPADTIRLSIGSSGSTFLYFGAAFSVPLTAPPGAYSAGITISHPDSSGKSFAWKSGRVSGPAYDTTVTRSVEVVELTGADAPESRPTEFRLHQNFPNPFNPATTITFELPEAAHVTLSIFNALGQEVAVVVDGIRKPGKSSVVFDAGDLPAGVYTCRLTAGAFTAAMRMLLVK